MIVVDLFIYARDIQITSVNPAFYWKQEALEA